MVVNNKILLLDDDDILRKTIYDILKAKGYNPIGADMGAAALDTIKTEQPAIALIDLKLTDMSGLEVMKRIKKQSPSTECIVLTGYASQESAIEAVNLGAYSYLKKPYDIEQLLLTIRRALEKREADEKIQRLNQDLERKVIERTAELESANRELEHFAYITSHDLKAPLRAIGNLAQWLAKDYADVLDDEGKEMTSMLTGRVKRMYGLIDGILEYSRVGRLTEEKRPINFNDLVRDTITFIASPDNIHITIENNLPEIVCEKTRIGQVFQNLIGNAVKFMDKPAGEVRVACLDEGTHYRFSVSDNGPGIDEKYHEKIFQIFQTLKPRDEFESTGIGLSIVKKIIELDDGKIWLESKSGQGTTFFFTLPKLSDL